MTCRSIVRCAPRQRVLGKKVQQRSQVDARCMRSGTPIVRAGIPQRFFQRCSLCGVFTGELEQTLAQIHVGGITDETAATLGLFAKV
jgi:hypothetical protein